MKNFVDAAWLQNHLNEDNVFILDVRFDLFDPAKAGREKYNKSHIPGAFYFDMDTDITENKGANGGRRATPDPYVLGKKLADLGVNMDSTIVCYDDGVYSSPRAFWQLTYMGYQKVYVLDGGLNGWIQAGYEVTDEVPVAKGQGHYEGTLNPAMFAGKQCMKEAILDKDAFIIDSRAHDRYTGENEPLYKKKGHIPTAKNIHYLKNMKDDNFIGDIEIWKENFKEALNNKQIYLFCGSAIEACINYMFLLELGVMAKVYIGSMSEWVLDDTVQTKQGEE